MKMRATKKMPRGVLNRYRTRMLTAEPDTFEEPSLKWQTFYQHQGWAYPVADEPVSPPKRRGRPPKTEPEQIPEPEPAPEPAPVAAVEEEASPRADDYDLESMTNDGLRELAEDRGLELPAGYVKNDDLIALIRGAE